MCWSNSGCAAGLASGELCRVLVAGEPELLQQIARRIAVVAGPKARLDIGERSGVAREVRLLRQITDGRTRLNKAAAAVRLDRAGRNLEQRRLAGAVAADQTDALFRRYRELDTSQERRAAKGQANVFELDQRRRHHRQPLLVAA